MCRARTASESYLSDVADLGNWLRPVKRKHLESCVALRGFALRGLGHVRGFPFCGGKKGLRLPLAVEKGVLDSLVPHAPT